MVPHFARRYEEAIAPVRKPFGMDPGFNSGRRHLGMAHEQKGMYPEAIAEFQKSLEASRGSPFAPGSSGHACAVSGNRAKARQALSEGRELPKSRYVSPFATALIHAGLGENGRALDWLEKAAEDRSLEMIFLKVDPRFDRLHTNPRFAGLLRRMGLPTEAEPGGAAQEAVQPADFAIVEVMSLHARVAILAAAILILFGTVSAVLLHLLPGPHKETDYLVIGAVSTLVSLLALFLVLITGFMRLPNVFFKKRKSQSRP